MRVKGSRRCREGSLFRQSPPKAPHRLKTTGRLYRLLCTAGPCAAMWRLCFVLHVISIVPARLTGRHAPPGPASPSPSCACETGDATCRTQGIQAPACPAASALHSLRIPVPLLVPAARDRGAASCMAGRCANSPVLGRRAGSDPDYIRTLTECPGRCHPQRSCQNTLKSQRLAADLLPSLWVAE